ncbi:class D sortase [Rossellomorea sp. BNER]|uniref:class D sortase n=1 Tax=Rossellomorea sp. BNER TaxID=2962031 RepID=UPI003AF2C213|nr:class D sortase [Rossellomorea sp. BNER]
MGRILGVILIILAIPFIFHEQIKGFIFERFNEKVIVAIENDHQQVEKNLLEKLYIKDEKSIKVSGIEGVLSIPSINLEEPIFQGASVENLKNGVALVDELESFNENNIAIAGHKMNAYGILFNRLHEVTVGDEISIKTNEKTLTFIVTKRFEVTPEEVSVLEETDEKTITLITCESYNWDTDKFEERMIIRGVAKEI